MVSINIPADFLQFLEIYEKRPIRENTWGMRSHGMFFLWFILKEIQPKLVIESGIYKGQSSWMIEQAVPNAEIIAIDPDLSQRVYISPKAHYQTEDYSTVFIKKETLPAVAFFDDHVNAYARVVESYQKGIRHLIFDDNYPVGYDDVEKQHISLEKCFSMAEHREKAEHLRKLIKKYSILPQIIGTRAAYMGSHPMVANIPAIWKCLDDVDSSIREKMLIFHEDHLWYRWLTYVEL